MSVKCFVWSKENGFKIRLRKVISDIEVASSDDDEERGKERAEYDSPIQGSKAF